MLEAKLFSGLLAAALITSPASAAITYNWTSTYIEGLSWGEFEIDLDEFTPQFVFSEEAVANGSFTFRRACDECDSFGDPAEWLIAAYGPGGDPFVESLDIDISFDEPGTLSGWIEYYDDNSDYIISGGGTDWGGQMNSDYINCQHPTPCWVEGYWLGPVIIAEPERIPETPTLPIIAAFFGVWLITSRRTTSK